METLRLEKRIGGAIRGGHPWVYRDAVEFGDRDADPGIEVRVEEADGTFVGRGFTSEGPIAVRVFSTFDEALDTHFFTRRLLTAFELRARLSLGDTTAIRLCNGEGDRLPGVVIDRYGDPQLGKTWLVVRFDGESAARLSERVLDALVPRLSDLGVDGVLFRIGRTGLKPECVFGEAPPDEITIKEHGMELVANLFDGQKTGLFLDHRDSRLMVRGLSQGARVLNLYAYTGGFSVAAGLGGAVQVTSVDVAPKAIELAEKSWAKNGLSPELHEGIAMDVRDFWREERSPFDLIVSDPPSFAPNEEAVESALDAYTKLHRACLEHVAPGGLFIAASCSSHVRGDMFDETIELAARQTGRVIQVLDRSGAPADHPRLMAFPEGDYLDTVLCRVIS